MDYTPVIPKEKLVDGLYYRGRCRNATFARWNGQKQRFVYWRHKFGQEFLEDICCPEDDNKYDVFIADEIIDMPPRKIPFLDRL